MHVWTTTCYYITNQHTPLHMSGTLYAVARWPHTPHHSLLRQSTTVTDWWLKGELTSSEGACMDWYMPLYPVIQYAAGAKVTDRSMGHLHFGSQHICTHISVACMHTYGRILQHCMSYACSNVYNCVYTNVCSNVYNCVYINVCSNVYNCVYINV